MAFVEAKDWAMMIIFPFVVGLKKIDSWKDLNENSLVEHWGSLIVFAKNIKFCAHENKRKSSFKKLKSFVGILNKVTSDKHLSIWPHAIN